MKEARFHRDNLAKHGVDVDEAEEALLDGWDRRRGESMGFEVLGRTSEGRHLQLFLEIKEDIIWVFHGRDMSLAERRRYRRKRVRDGERA